MPLPVPVLAEGVDPAWLPPAAFRAIGSRRVLNGRAAHPNWFDNVRG